LLSWRKKEKLIRNIVFVLFCFKQKKLNLLGGRNHQKQFISVNGSVNGKIFCSFLPFVALKTKKKLFQKLFSKNFSELSLPFAFTMQNRNCLQQV
jgi:hypothetical protein